GRNFFERGTPAQGHIDLPRAREARFAGGFFAIFAPSQRQSNDLGAHRSADGYDFPMPPDLDPNQALRVTLDMAAMMFRIERESAGEVKVTRTVDDIEQAMASNVIAAVLHIEGADAIDTDLNALEVLYQAGLRSLGFVWSRNNAFAHGVPLRFPATPDLGPGLTDAGKALVRACNQLGIMIDLSHITEAGFWDVAAITDAPLVATHSNVHALCAHARNLTDKQLDAIKETGGMVGLNFGVGFLREDGAWNTDTPLSTMVRHIDYLVERVGIEHVGFGSDLDGAKIPDAFGDVTGFPKLVAALRAAGYDDDSLEKLCHRNWLNLLRRTL
ncbi:MAG: dipeptidase, partial [Chloroflexota bacterium]